MCGILGSINYPFDLSLLNLISHRGPDDFGIVNLMVGNDHVCLGQRRLSIVDLSLAGHQPMATNCGNYNIVFNGEIYNHNDLKTKLSDIEFRGHSDTETILYYLARYGIDGLKDLNGIFALAFFDNKNGSIFIARDRFGVKPLYYATDSSKFLFASEIRPIQKVLESKLDKGNLSVLLRLRYNPSPDTLYENIKKVQPGNVISINIKTRELNEEPFYKPNFIPSNLSFNQALDKYEELLNQAVKRQMMSDVEIGVLLSGGIDSAIIAQKMKFTNNSRIQAFTVGYHEKHFSDEISDAAETAKFLDLEHHVTKINYEEFSSIFEKVVNIIEEPCGILSILPFYFLCESVSKKGIKVVLTGQGADEPWGGYSKYQGELIRKYIPSILYNSDYFKNLNFVKKNEKIYRAIHSLSEKDEAKRFEKIFAIFSEEEIVNLTGYYNNKSVSQVKKVYDFIDGSNRPSINALMSCDLRMDLSDDLLNYTDKISMHFGLEARVPFLDNPLIEFIESLSVNYKIGFGKTKILHKKYAEKIFPNKIVHRKKNGFLTPSGMWFKDENRNNFRETLTSNNSVFSNYFDKKFIHKLFDEHIKQGINREKQIFTLLSIYYWMKNNL